VILNHFTFHTTGYFTRKALVALQQKQCFYFLWSESYYHVHLDNILIINISSHKTSCPFQPIVTSNQNFNPLFTHTADHRVPPAHPPPHQKKKNCILLTKTQFSLSTKQTTTTTHGSSLDDKMFLYNTQKRGYKETKQNIAHIKIQNKAIEYTQTKNLKQLKGIKQQHFITCTMSCR
jgi:hypothetical protein